MSRPARSRSRQLGLLTESARVEAFSDGVLAIAITLLVLDLRDPSTRGSFVHDLLHQWPSYLAYLAAFVTIGVVWVNHHVLFTRVRRVDPALLWSNLLLLGSSSVLPFPTSVLAGALESGTRHDRTGATVLYALVSMVQALSWLLLYRHLRHAPELLADGVDTHVFGGEQGRAMIGMTLYAALALVSLVVPTVAAVLVLVMPVFYGLTSHGLAVRGGALTAGDQPEIVTTVP